MAVKLIKKVIYTGYKYQKIFHKTILFVIKSSNCFVYDKTTKLLYTNILNTNIIIIGFIFTQ